MSTSVTELHPVEVDLLCALAEVEAPFPLDVPSTGTTQRERQLMFGAAREQLAARGLADDRGPLGVAHEFVRMLRTSLCALDMVLAVGEQTLGAVVMVDDTWSVIAVQRPDVPGKIIAMRATTLDESIGELIGMIPRLGAANAPAFTLPLRPIRAVFGKLTDGYDEDSGEQPTMVSVAELDDMLYASGVDAAVSHRMMTNLRTVTGSGQVGLARRPDITRDWQRGGDEIRWLDTPRGRFRLVGGDEGGDGADWVGVNPFSPQDLRAALRELAAQARG